LVNRVTQIITLVKIRKFADFDKFMVEIKAMKSNGLKVIVQIGEEYWLGSNQFSIMARSQEARAIFVASVSEIVDKYDLDGFIPNWRFPACPNVKFTITDKFSSN
jgi:GH18 family chitinase